MAVKVEYEHLESTATGLKQGQAEIEAQLRKLQQTVDDLVHNGFVTDKSSGAFQGAYNEFNEGVTKTIAGLEGMAGFLKTTSTTFQDVDSQLASSIPS